jgi:hypothetical protein
MAIFQDQPINLEAVRGVSPERFVQRAERQQQAIVGDFLRMQQGIQAGIQEFEQKRAEKQNMQASLQLLKELGAVEGLSDESIKAGIKNAGGATNFLKTITDMETAAQQSRLVEAEIAQMGMPKLPKPLTASEIKGVAQLMERPEFKGIKFDKETGEAYMEVPNKETLMPFDKKRVSVPAELQAMEGFPEYAAMMRKGQQPAVGAGQDPLGLGF